MSTGTTVMFCDSFMVLQRSPLYCVSSLSAAYCNYHNLSATLGLTRIVTLWWNTGGGWKRSQIWFSGRCTLASLHLGYLIHNPDKHFHKITWFHQASGCLLVTKRTATGKGCWPINQSWELPQNFLTSNPSTFNFQVKQSNQECRDLDCWKKERNTMVN